MELTKRRVSKPFMVQRLWDAIILSKEQRQVPKFDRLYNVLRRRYGHKKHYCEKHLRDAVKDNLVHVMRKTGCKGNMIGEEQESYLMPVTTVAKPRHDWYCFECHDSGDVWGCVSCFRVYHPRCLKEEAKFVRQNERFCCPTCKAVQAPNTVKLRKDELNKLLIFTCKRLKKKPIPEIHNFPLKTELDVFRASFLIHNMMSLNIMEEKTQNAKYNRLEEFQADAQNICHNITIFYGAKAPVTSKANLMFEDCVYDLAEIRLCHDCYRMSNEKNDKYWFCQPCNPPHDLVYAKVKGFQYWPAKVIRKLDDVYDVRFFGGFHERANVEVRHIKPITCGEDGLGIKRCPSWDRACEELYMHQELLRQAGFRIRTVSVKDHVLELPNGDCREVKEKRSPSKCRKGDEVPDGEFGKSTVDGSGKPAVDGSGKSAVDGSGKSVAEDSSTVGEDGLSEPRKYKSLRLIMKALKEHDENEKAASRTAGGKTARGNATGDVPKEKQSQVSRPTKMADEGQTSGGALPEGKPNGKAGLPNATIDANAVNLLKRNDSVVASAPSNGANSVNGTRKYPWPMQLEARQIKKQRLDGKTVIVVHCAPRPLTLPVATSAASVRFKSLLPSRTETSSGHAALRCGDARNSHLQPNQQSESSGNKCAASMCRSVSGAEVLGNGKDGPGSMSTGPKLEGRDDANNSATDTSASKSNRENDATDPPMPVITLQMRAAEGEPRPQCSEMQGASTQKHRHCMQNLSVELVRISGGSKTTKLDGAASVALENANHHSLDRCDGDQVKDEPAFQGTNTSVQAKPIVDPDRTVPALGVGLSLPKTEDPADQPAEGLRDAERQGAPKQDTVVVGEQSSVGIAERSSAGIAKASKVDAAKDSGKESNANKGAESRNAPEGRRGSFSGGVKSEVLQPSTTPPESSIVSSFTVATPSAYATQSKIITYQDRVIVIPFINRQPGVRTPAAPVPASPAGAILGLPSELEASQVVEQFVSSSAKLGKQSNLAQEDHAVVSSSSQETAFFPSVGTQTSPASCQAASKCVQTDHEPATSERAEAEANAEALKEMKEKLEAEFEASREKLIQDVTAKLEKEHNDDKERAVTAVSESLQKSIEDLQDELKTLRDSHELEVASLKEKHVQHVSDVKKMQWCYNCEAEAIYHCCWNTSYCSTECQQVHWQREHKRNCRRKR